MAWLGQRPETPMSGVLLQTEYSIQHRSDLLMLEHVINVRNCQESLQKALKELESAKPGEDMHEKRKVVEECREKSENMVLVLQVMDKLNKEVAYARSDLDEALYNGRGNINAARKRVIWLEDKMGALCGKKRLKSNVDLSLSLVQVNLPDMESERMDSYRDDSERAQLSELDSVAAPSSDEGILGLAHVDVVPQRNRYTQQTATEAVSLTAALKRAKIIRDMEKQSQITEKEATPEPLYKHKPLILALSDSEEESETETETDSYYGEDNEQEDGKSGQEEDKEEESDREDDKESVKINVKKQELDIEETQEAPIQQEPLSDRPSDVTASQDSEIKPVVKQSSDVALAKSREGTLEKGESSLDKATTFLTEVSTPKSRVTIHDEKKSVADTDQMPPPESPDLANQYWESEHHRFELSDFANVMRDVDPLSYHNVGLAIPGSFIHREDSQFEELPWRPHRKGSDIKDIHRIALDKLATRVHGIQDKLYSAAMLSVKKNKNETEMPRESSFLHNFDNKQLQAYDDTRPVTVETVELPKLEERRLGTSCSGRLVYYPKPIPPPDVLPITRTNQNKVFPRLTSTFADVEEHRRKPAQRLVDQRNLLEETKLVLYKERPKGRPRGPSVHERRFRRMMERDKTASTKASAKKLKHTFSMATAMAKMQGEPKELVASQTASFSIKQRPESPQFESGISTWGKIKPKTNGNEYSGLRWERVKTIIHTNLMSPNVEERKDAAKQLGNLRCGDTMVFFALKERLNFDDDQRVRYECAKSLILIGCWEEEVLQVILKFLTTGNTEIRQDLISTMISGKNVQYVNKNMPTFPEVVKVLSHFCRNPDPEDPISFEAAVLLGRLCVADPFAKEKLKKAVTDSDSHVKTKAVEILVKQLNCTEAVVVTSIQDILRTSSVWKHRELAAKLLVSLGPGHPCVRKDNEEIYQLLERRLWDDPSKEVRTQTAKALTSLGMFARACEKIEKRLEDPEEEARAQAAISVGTLGMRSEKLTRLMLEMLELDASDYVRLMIIRAFAALKLTDRRVMRTLREREKMEGPLARESRKALKTLEAVLSAGTRTPRTLTPNTPHRKTTVK